MGVAGHPAGLMGTSKHPETERIAKWQRGLAEQGLVLDFIADIRTDRDHPIYHAIVMSREARAAEIEAINDRYLTDNIDARPLDFIPWNAYVKHPLRRTALTGASAVARAKRAWQEQEEMWAA